MAAPKKDADEKLSEPANTWLTPAQKMKLQADRQAAGLSEAEFIRRRIADYRIPPSRSLSDAALVAEVNRIGVNVNQLAAATHMDRQFVEYWREIGKELEAVLVKVAAAYDS